MSILRDLREVLDGQGEIVTVDGVKLTKGEAATALVAVKPGLGYGVTTDKGPWGNGRWVVKPTQKMTRAETLEEVNRLRREGGGQEYTG